jgi:hypothetical protein
VIEYLKSIFGRKTAKESEMAEATPPTQQPGSAAAQSQGAPDLVKLVADAIAAAIAPLAESLKAQGEALAKLQAPPAAKPKVEEPKALTLEDVSKLLEQRAAAKAATAAKTAKRQATLDALKAAGVPEDLHVHVPDTDDEAALKSSADKLIARWAEIGPKKPDVGGAAKDGGKTPGKENPVALVTGLTPAQAAYAAK